MMHAALKQSAATTKRMPTMTRNNNRKRKRGGKGKANDRSNSSHNNNNNNNNNNNDDDHAIDNHQTFGVTFIPSALSQDFRVLAQQYPAFRQEWEALSNYTNNDKNHETGGAASKTAGGLASRATPAFQLSLTRALLDHHFSIQLPSMPPNHLCPPVPNRWSYCQWMQQYLVPLLTDSNYFASTTTRTDTTTTTTTTTTTVGTPDTTRDNPSESSGWTACNRGLDLGTGASAIYSLLLTKANPRLLMVATEVDDSSIASAQLNIQANSMVHNRISVIKVPQTSQQTVGKPGDGPISVYVQQQESTKTKMMAKSIGDIDSHNDALFDFCLTNPPFYSIDGDSGIRHDRADGRDRTPMTDTEGIYPGGEVGWVLDMVRDSLIHRRRIGWYSSMLSKKTSWLFIRRILVDLLGYSQVQTHELDVGRMRRWFVAWTFLKPCRYSPGEYTGVWIYGPMHVPSSRVISSFCLSVSFSISHCCISLSLSLSLSTHTHTYPSVTTTTTTTNVGLQQQESRPTQNVSL